METALARWRHADGPIEVAPVPCDGCDLPLTAAEIACGETLCEECRDEDEAEERANDDR